MQGMYFGSDRDAAELTLNERNTVSATTINAKALCSLDYLVSPQNTILTNLVMNVRTIACRNTQDKAYPRT